MFFFILQVRLLHLVHERPQKENGLIIAIYAVWTWSTLVANIRTVSVCAEAQVGLGLRWSHMS